MKKGKEEYSEEKDEAVTSEKVHEKISKSSEEKGKEDAADKVQTEEKENARWIRLNPRYMTICRYALFVIVLAIVVYMLISNWTDTLGALSRLVGILTPFLIGILIAYFLSPMVGTFTRLLNRYIMKEKHPKVTMILAMVISYTIVLGFITIAFVFVIPQMGQSIQELTNKVPDMYKRVTRELNFLQERYPELNTEGLSEKLESMVPNLVGFGTNLMTNIVPMVYSFSVSIVKFAINIVLALIISIYMIFSKKKFHFQGKRLVYAFFPEEKGDAVCTTLRECNDIFSAFLISKAIDSLIIGCLCCIAMNIIGLPYSVLLSVIVGITNMIPYFGPFIGAVPGVLIYLCTNWEQALIFAIMILVLQQFDGLILGPRLLGQSTGLSPIWVIFGITVGGAYFGVVGMFIGVPVVAVVAFLIDKLISSRLKGRRIKALEEFEKEKG